MADTTTVREALAHFQIQRQALDGIWPVGLEDEAKLTPAHWEALAKTEAAAINLTKARDATR